MRNIILGYPAIFFEFVPPFHKATLLDPTPFLGHITYNPVLAFAAYLLIHSILFSKNMSTLQKVIYSIFAVTMSINIFITGGRSGQIMYFAALVILIFQYFSKQLLKAFLISLVSIPLLVAIFYNSSTLFKTRADRAILNISDYQKDINSSASLRINFTINSFEIIKENPIFGVGTGGFESEYKKINQELTPQAKAPVNPHNMYIFQTVEFGFFGLLIFLSLFMFQMKHALNTKDILLKNIGLALPLLFMVVMLGESYLLIPTTSYLFVLFSSFLYKKYPETT
jgi:O-antigen ligase